MEYNFREIEKKWQQEWNDKNVYQVANDPARPKYYVLDMFPYPSGAGLHVGHPLGYIASDIFARYKRLKGFNVLHPMGYDAFGLPAEQYAIEHGIHPAVSTEANIKNFRSQLNKIGFCYDWSREVNTSKPEYYKWTQWLFLKLYNSYFCNTCKQAKPIDELIAKYEKKGSSKFTAEEWNSFSTATKEEWLMKRRLIYSAYGDVNWCEALGTVLANDEVVNGVSERGGHPVEKRKMRQWYLRITAYADRLLQGLEKVDFSDSMKEMQTNWIGKSSGAEVDFEIKGQAQKLRVYTTRPDTIFGVDFMVVAPEMDLIHQIKSKEQEEAVAEYLGYVKSRSDRERMSEKKITGVFTGAYAINPFDGREIPIWVSEYVLAGYGTGAIMAVPCGDERDFRFAKHFNIPITNIIGHHFNGEEANATKEAVLENSDFLNGMVMKDALETAIQKIEEKGIGKRKINYKMRDAGFSRQRYWGEPFPVSWKNDVPFALDESVLPLELPYMDDIRHGEKGEGPLANNEVWMNSQVFAGGKAESSTMPGYAGSSWYFLRYMDPANEKEFCSRAASDYWGQVDLYVGGTEHAVGHLLYSRMWTKVLYDLGLIGFDEPFKKLLNQGMIQGSSRFVYRLHGTNTFVSKSLLNNEDEYEGKQLDKIHVDVNMVDGLELDTNAFVIWRNNEHAGAVFILDDGKYICGVETEKMSKSKFNTVNPDDLVYKYGADTFRMYEMFLGPVEMSKPWDTKGIEGVHRFLKKFWRLFFDEQKGKIWTDEKATSAELKVLHKTIKKIEEDTERFSFNTCVSTFMICVNELTDLKCHKKEILNPLLILITPYAPHIAEELYQQINATQTDEIISMVLDATFPKWDEKYIKESSKAYPVAINGKTRTELTLSLDITQPEVEALVLQDAIVQKWLDGKVPKKIIYVKNKMINVVM
ncbi:MAG TPA: leucine--tRNA ligase [Chitinophagaceae bacterium]|jgi:leucyl-tRNA synthetase|nr:leucine--tRNA ligase [Chitinophagaceae bacterium]HNK61393.1 leucine--tRNA ligase [Chitinophagaceae bacterium]